jgi:UDP-glucose 4-epimerase
MMMDINTLITGGAGFIGSWLVGKCLNRGWRVWVYDNFEVGREENLARYAGQVQVIKADILDRERLTFVMKANSINLVYHLAAYHYIPFCNTYPVETIRVNVEGTASVLQAAAESGVQRAIIASSGAIYRSIDQPLNEDNIEIVAPVDIYGWTKLMAEQVARYYAEHSPLCCIVARLFNTYGPYETNMHLIPHIIERLKKTRDRVELGNIYTKRDYIYVDDAAEALVCLADVPVEEKFMIFNIGTGKEYSVIEIVQTIAHLIGRPIQIVQNNERMRKVDKEHQIADISKLKQACNWQPRYSLVEGLKELLLHEGLITDLRDVSQC